MAVADRTAGARLIREIRGRSGLTQAELARRAGVPRSVLNAYERGKREPGAGALAQIAHAAGMQLTVGMEPGRLDPSRAARLLEQVLDLAESLPRRRRGPLRYPPLRARPA